VLLNGLSNVEAVCCAVGASEGEADFYHAASGLPTSSSLSADLRKYSGNLTSSRVPVLTLDRFLRDRAVTGVDLVKLDTELTEPQVLAGMAETLARDRPVVLCEVLSGQTAEALETIFRGLDYRMCHISPAGLVPRTRIESHPEWLNYLFAPSTHEVVRGL
jgi:FkbM family methyltransferase